MPFSTNYFKQQTINFITKNYPKHSKILDIGAGCGTYYNLLNPLGYENIDAVEIYEKYIKDYNLEKKYKNIILGNICELEIDYSIYDLISLGDVLEHIGKKEAKKLIQKIGNTPILVAVPFESEQSESFGNSYEIHLQSDLTLDIFLERYENLKPFCLRFDYGVFTNAEIDTIYIETGEKNLSNEYLKKLSVNFPDKKIKNVNEIEDNKEKLEPDSSSTNKKKTSKTTIVTGLWNLGREKISESFSRKYEDYLKTFSKLLETDVNMYIF